ncbi:polysaccharide pyruvyl transferase family protein [Aquamicrobium sp. LC103]|uniref:polysaccharide pyruvyl transferase family protein n=1 Tax=Aquamicrobium sp. LC103 TaxID=1120658 RepID=UPI00063E7454|nr:polysaccharide pyruvyl transferase family protein [Aquamicrobium sp. LC103]TKT76743.1 polysaccharide pyruvyl transferase family protein [Aquamicrobium sp. LC103]
MNFWKKWFRDIDGSKRGDVRAEVKFGVLTFGYDSFANFREELSSQGYYETNLGDNAQSIAVRHVYRQLGIHDDQMVDINRDALPQYDGEPAILLMNGVFYSSCFPLPAAITPVFIGFHASEQVIKEQQELLRKHQPIGCRDEATTARMKKHGIDAFTTGCATLTLPRREEEPKTPKLLIVYGRNAGRLPPVVFRSIPERLLADADLIYHRFHESRFPLDAEMQREAERHEEALFARYRREATLVLTSLHHVATPCMAFGIPTIICRVRNDARFSLIEKWAPIYTPDKFEQIDWYPPAVDVSAVRADFLQAARQKIATARR